MDQGGRLQVIHVREMPPRLAILGGISENQVAARQTGGFLHYNRPSHPPQQTSKQDIARAAVLSRLVRECLGITVRHFNMLQRFGLDEETIFVNSYSSSPSEIGRLFAEH